MAKDLVRKILEIYLQPASDYLFGFADLTEVIDPVYRDFPYGISIGKRLNCRIVDSIIDGPTSEYYAHYNQTNYELERLSGEISSELNRHGIETRCVEPTISTESLETGYSSNLRTALSHKMVATRSGLGWIGKTDLLVTKEFGPRLRFVTILTRTPLSNLREPIERSRCGSCRDCVDICPAGAATGELWDTGTDRDQFFNAWKCRDMCRQFGENLPDNNARICGICVSVCPLGMTGKKSYQE